ncbi:MAG TPA: acetyltransferase [Vicinamibacterales bacterium]|nr:acetyltransferase [Vicinamibacterales bacterium]
MKIVVIGAGGHAKVVLDVARSTGMSDADVLGFVDDNVALIGTRVSGFPVIGPIDALPPPREARVIMGIGDNALRCRLFARLRERGYEILTVIHRSAIVAPGCTLGDGVVVMAQAAVNVDTRIGDNVVLNTGCTVDHDCAIGAHAHIAPGANLAGGVVIGEQTLIGIGSAVIPGVAIGPRTIVGAGSVVTKDIGADCVVAGVPARVIR